MKLYLTRSDLEPEADPQTIGDGEDRGEADPQIQYTGVHNKGGEALGNGDTGYCYRRRAEDGASRKHGGRRPTPQRRRGRRGEAASTAREPRGDRAEPRRAPRGNRGDHREGREPMAGEASTAREPTGRGGDRARAERRERDECTTGGGCAYAVRLGLGLGK